MSDHPKMLRELAEEMTYEDQPFSWANTCTQAASAFELLEAEHEALRAEYKNFHRGLCERFDCLHDAKHWRRDLASLEEWIANRIKTNK